MIDPNYLLITVMLSGIFMILLVALLIYYRTHREARYNQDAHRAELEMLRESFERRIYELNDRLVSTEGRWRDVNHLLESRLMTQPEFVEQNLEIPITNFLKSYGITETDLKIDPNLVFVLTPFNKKFEHPFTAIAKACREMGFHCLRGDEEPVRGDLMAHILRLIAKARVIVANIDGRNPNVFYELGVAHALDKVTIIVTKSINSVPFDLQSKKLIVYQDTDDLEQGLQKELARSLIQM